MSNVEGHSCEGNSSLYTLHIWFAQFRKRNLYSTKALTLTLLTWRIWWAPNNARKWQIGFNSAYKGLRRKEQRISLNCNTTPRAWAFVRRIFVGSLGSTLQSLLLTWDKWVPGAHYLFETVTFVSRSAVEIFLLRIIMFSTVCPPTVCLIYFHLIMIYLTMIFAPKSTLFSL